MSIEHKFAVVRVSTDAILQVFNLYSVLSTSGLSFLKLLQ